MPQDGLDNFRFVIVIPSYNNIKWWHGNILSALQQQNKNFRIIYIDDASTDGTGTAVESWLKKNNIPLINFLLIRNERRHGALLNFYRAIHACDDNEIIVCLDGDDQLYNNQVLNRLTQEYKKNILATYGQYQDFPGNKIGYCKLLNKDASLRKQQFVLSHLRTFYAWLFKKIKIEDFLYEDKFYPMAWDLAIMYPLIEMAGTRYSFIPDILYRYNRANIINDHKVNGKMQHFLAKDIRNKISYTVLSKGYKNKSASNGITLLYTFIDFEKIDIFIKNINFLDSQKKLDSVIFFTNDVNYSYLQFKKFFDLTKKDNIYFFDAKESIQRLNVFLQKINSKYIIFNYLHKPRNINLSILRQAHLNFYFAGNDQRVLINEHISPVNIKERYYLARLKIINHKKDDFFVINRRKLIYYLSLFKKNSCAMFTKELFDALKYQNPLIVYNYNE
jgi:glycosyltransferase involved in cell wall biosynthesis